MNSYQNSLTNLFKAEEEANDIIRRAEERREELLDVAIQDAHAEIIELRKKEEKKFEEFTKANKNNFEEIERTTEETKKQADEEFSRNKQKVLDFLQTRICNVNLDLQRNVKGDFVHTYRAAK